MAGEGDGQADDQRRDGPHSGGPIEVEAERSVMDRAPRLVRRVQHV